MRTNLDDDLADYVSVPCRPAKSLWAIGYGSATIGGQKPDSRDDWADVPYVALRGNQRRNEMRTNAGEIKDAREEWTNTVRPAVEAGIEDVILKAQAMWAANYGPICMEAAEELLEGLQVLRVQVVGLGHRPEF